MAEAQGNRRKEDAHMMQLDKDVTDLKATVAALSTGMESVVTGLSELKQLVLSDRARPSPVVPYLTVFVSILFGLGGAGFATANYIALSQQPLTEAMGVQAKFDAFALDEIVKSVAADAASEVDRDYLREEVRYLRARIDSMGVALQ